MKKEQHRASLSPMVRNVVVLVLTVLVAFVYTHRDDIFALAGITGLCVRKDETLQVQYKTELLDIDEEEYLSLGLTPQRPIQIIPVTNDHTLQPKTIHGRFLHITDIHPDEFYVEGKDIDNVCHRGKPGKAEDRASKYGDAMRGCDSPMILMNETMKWIKKNLRNKIDFVIWTGDNIRHDQDRKIPRSENEIFEMNKRVATLFHDIFHEKNEADPRVFDVPVVPSLGNNDVYPHNLFAPGPTLQTRELWNMWQDFIPQEQLHIFERGAYYFSEIIPNKLAILSINTLYLFKSNPLVDSCDSKKDPGYELFKWLGITLQELRDRNMKVWLSGHVPPIPKNFDISCYRKFTIWVHEYRDVIIGGVYGHMNIDHYIPLDAQKAYKSFEQAMQSKGYELDSQFTRLFYDDDDEDEMDLETQYLNMGYNVSDHDLNVAVAAKEAHALGGIPENKEKYMDTVRETFYADVKKKKKAGEFGERYAITNVAASIVPTFNSGIRVWEYNITGLEDITEISHKPWTQFFKELEAKMDAAELEDEEGDDDEVNIEKKKNKKKKKKKKPDPTIPPKMPEDSEVGPAYSPQTFSPLRFVQYYLDLKAINEGDKEFNFEVEYTSDGAPYNMKGLLVNDFLKLARKFGEPLKKSKAKEFKPLEEEEEEEDDDEEWVGIDKKTREVKLNELWETYCKHAFVSSGYRDEE